MLHTLRKAQSASYGTAVLHFPSRLVRWSSFISLRYETSPLSLRYEAQASIAACIIRYFFFLRARLRGFALISRQKNMKPVKALLHIAQAMLHTLRKAQSASYGTAVLHLSPRLCRLSNFVMKHLLTQIWSASVNSRLHNKVFFFLRARLRVSAFKYTRNTDSLAYTCLPRAG